MNNEMSVTSERTLVNNVNSRNLLKKMPFFRFCCRLIFQVSVSIVEWLVWCILSIYKHPADYVLRAPRREAVEHEYEEGKLYVQNVGVGRIQN